MSLTKLERDWQANLIKDLKLLFPGCYIRKNNANVQPGIPDLIILWHDRWAILEVKKSINEPYQVNQEYFIEQFNNMSFAAMICPENKSEVLDALQTALRSYR
jgi:hypothetical protein